MRREVEQDKKRDSCDEQRNRENPLSEYRSIAFICSFPRGKVLALVEELCVCNCV